MKRLLILTVIFASILIALNGCGGSGSGPSRPTPTPNPTSTPTPTPTSIPNWKNVGGPLDASTGSIALFIYNGIPYIAYNSGGQLVIAKYNASGDWTFVGAANAPTAVTCVYSLVVYDTDKFYVSYKTTIATKPYNAKVWKFDGTAWTDLNAPFTADATYNAPLAFDNDTLYLAFNNNTQINAYTYSGSWAPLGAAFGGFRPSLYIFNHIPYIGFRDSAHGYKTTVNEYITNWQAIGTAGFSDDMADNSSTFVGTKNSQLTFYVSSVEQTSTQITVKKKSGSGSWVTLGTRNFSVANVDWTSIFAVNGVPYLAYHTSANNAYILTYNGIDWVSYGSPAFSAYTYHISFYGYNGTPYIAYFNISDHKIYVMKCN